METGKETSTTFPWLKIQFHDLKIDKRTGEWKRWVKCPTGWAFWCLTPSFLNFVTFQPPAKNNFGKNLKFHDISMTQTTFSNLHDFSRPGMQISNSMTFDHLFMTMWTLDCDFYYFFYEPPKWTFRKSVSFKQNCSLVNTLIATQSFSSPENGHQQHNEQRYGSPSNRSHNVEFGSWKQRKIIKRVNC